MWPRASHNLPGEHLCHECKLLHESSEGLMHKSPRNAIYYFMDMFMRSRRHTLTEDQIENCIWDAWWMNQRGHAPS